MNSPRHLAQIRLLSSVNPTFTFTGDDLVTEYLAALWEAPYFVAKQAYGAKPCGKGKLHIQIKYNTVTNAIE